jgi:hypothetical protein
MKPTPNGKDEMGPLVHALHKLKHVQQDLQQEINHIEAKLNPPPPPL